MMTLNNDTYRDELAKLLPKGKTAYTVLRHVSASGMSRDISVVVVDGDDLRDITWLISRAWPDHFRLNNRSNDFAIRVHGAGMDMGFDLVYSVSRLLHDGNGYALNQRWL